MYYHERTIKTLPATDSSPEIPKDYHDVKPGDVIEFPEFDEMIVTNVCCDEIIIDRLVTVIKNDKLDYMRLNRPNLLKCLSGLKITIK